MSGFIAAYREAVDHPLFKGHADKLGAWTWLLMRAAWKQTKIDVSGKIVTVERGQLSVSIRHLSEAWGWSKSTTERFITRLKTETMIETHSGTGRLLITICNYDKYQSISENGGTPSGTASGTAAGQQRDIKEQGNKGTRDIEPNGPISQDAHVPDVDAEVVVPEPVIPEPTPTPAKAKRNSKWSTIDRPEDVTPEVWRDYEHHRRSKGAPITETVIGAMRREAAKAGWSIEEAIMETILRNWQGFKAEWVQGNDRGNRKANGPDAGRQSYNPMVEAYVEGRSGGFSEQPELYE